MSTYLEICKDVRAQAGIAGEGPTDVTGQSGIYADVVRWVDEGYNYIQSMHENWNFLFESYNFTLQSGFDQYDIDSLDVRQISKDSFLRQFQAGDKERLIYVPYAVWRTQDRFLKADTGKPQYVTELPTGELKFYPTADDDYNILFEGYSRPNVMTARTDTPIFNTQYEELIKLQALIRYGEYYSSGDIFKSATGSFNTMIKQMQYSELPKDNLVTPTFVPFA